MTRRLVVLGSGTSFGVPVIGCECPVCTSEDPRDRRTRVAAVVESGAVRLLIDTPPELRLQLVRARIEHVDAVLYTHDHADHVHGIDDLRALSVRHGLLPVYGPPDTVERLRLRFGYIFDDAVIPRAGTSRPHLRLTPLVAGEEVVIAGIRVLPLQFDHGGMCVFGYRIRELGYLTDVKTVPEEAFATLAGVEVLVINALFERPHPTHLSIPEALEVGQRLGVRRLILTHLSHRYAHADLVRRLPEWAEPAHDGLSVPF
jgi:phosphoribosyl 1,2-cyclic phosphate phosphodiesterase